MYGYLYVGGRVARSLMRACSVEGVHLYIMAQKVIKKLEIYRKKNGFYYNLFRELIFSYRLCGTLIERAT